MQNAKFKMEIRIKSRIKIHQFYFSLVLHFAFSTLYFSLFFFRLCYFTVTDSCIIYCSIISDSSSGDFLKVRYV